MKRSRSKQKRVTWRRTAWLCRRFRRSRRFISRSNRNNGRAERVLGKRPLALQNTLAKLLEQRRTRKWKRVVGAADGHRGRDIGLPVDAEQLHQFAFEMQHRALVCLAGGEIP